MAVVNDNYLIRLVGASKKTIDMYLCRAEFAHIIRTFSKGHTYYHKITNHDVKRLQELFHSKNLQKRSK